MSRNIIIIGTLDTRGEEIQYLKQRIEERGHKGHVIDVGVLGQVPFEPFITRHEVAEAAETSIKEIIAQNHEGRAMSTMARGMSKLLKAMIDRNEADGVIAAGGSMSTSLALEAMTSLPIGFPKFILSTIAFSSFVNTSLVCPDLCMMLWPGGLYGLNSISRRVLDSAAGAISGMVETLGEQDTERKKVVGITSLGISQLTYIKALKPALEERGYEVAVFHTTGMGGRAFEQAINDGLIDVALDLSLVELVDYVNGGATSSGEFRLKAASRKGIPQIIGAGGIGHFFWFSGKPLPPQFQGRKQHRHNQLMTIVVAETDDKRKVAELAAERLNLAEGPTAVIIPLKGWIEGDRHPKSPFHDSKGGEEFSRAFKAKIKPGIKVIELDAHVNDPAFCESVIKLFDEMVG